MQYFASQDKARQTHLCACAYTDFFHVLGEMKPPAFVCREPLAENLAQRRMQDQAPLTLVDGSHPFPFSCLFFFFHPVPHLLSTPFLRRLSLYATLRRTVCLHECLRRQHGDVLWLKHLVRDTLAAAPSQMAVLMTPMSEPLKNEEKSSVYYAVS